MIALGRSPKGIKIVTQLAWQSVTLCHIYLKGTMIKDQLREDMKTAMKAGDKMALNTIRFLLSEIRNVEIDNGELNDEQIQDVIRKQIKQMQESNVQYAAGGRDDLVSDNEAKILVLSTYIPAMLTAEELAIIVKEVIAANPGLAMGPIIGQVRAKTGGKADGGAIATEVKLQLGAQV